MDVLRSSEETSKLTMELKTEHYRPTEEQQIVFDYWNSKRNVGKLPARRDLDVLDIHKIMPLVVIFEVRQQPLDFLYRLVGTAVTENSHQDYTGKLLSSLDGKGPGSMIWKSLDTVRQNREVIFSEVPYVGPKDDLLRSTLLLLPLADDGETVDRVLLVVAFHKTF